MRQFLTYDGLSARQRSLAPALDWTDGDPPSIPDQIASARVRGRPFQSYEALYLVVDGVPMAKVGWIRIAFRSRRGTEVVCGLADVVTRGDVTRRGYARSLLREVHRRAKTAGFHWSFLWTRRSWGAHRAYEKEGYRDVYSPTIALRRIPRRVARPKLPRGYTLRGIRPSDARTLEEILSAATSDRVGFIPRESGSFAVRFRLGWRKPKDWWILRHERVPVGFAQLQKDRWDVLCRELVTKDPRTSGLWIRLAEWVAQGKWLALGNTTFVGDNLGLLRQRGYAVVRGTHGVLMACPLGRATNRDWEGIQETFHDSRLSLHGGDMF